jgi:hypothetical protein
MIATIVDSKSMTHPVNIILVPLRCSVNDETSIKHCIESRKNDPSTLIAILLHDTPKTAMVQLKADLDELKEIIKQCESITVSFIHLDEVEKFIQTREKNDILHNYSPN